MGHDLNDFIREGGHATPQGSSFSLTERAASAEAINLLTGQTQTSQFPEEVRRDLDFVILDGGRNGWTGPDEKAQAQSYLTEHIRAGRLTPDQAAAYALIGVRPRSQAGFETS